MKLIKLLTAITSLFVIIPDQKLSFPVAALVLIEFADSFNGILFSLGFIAGFVYLLISAFSKFDNEEDDYVIITILLASYVLLITQYKAIFAHGDVSSFASQIIYIALSATAIFMSVVRLRKRKV